MNKDLAFMSLAHGFNHELTRLNELLVQPVTNEQGFNELLSIGAFKVTRDDTLRSMATKLETYHYYLPSGSHVALVIQSNGEMCNRFVSDGLNEHTHVVGLTVEYQGFVLNPLLSVYNNVETHVELNNVLLWLTKLSVQLEFKKSKSSE